jgi:predicted  nucleic acid-binding Zn-ribbon protein
MADTEDLDWLDALEQRVHEATARLQDLANENATLTARIGDLERQLEESTPEGDEKAATAWKQERHDIRRRVERLTEDLESLLEDR